jgi:hypothetical protein
MQLYHGSQVGYMYNEMLPVGPNTIGTLCKAFAKELGFSDWDKCTGHGLRKMGIAHAMTYSEKNIAPLVLGMSRHKNYQTSLSYQKPNKDMYKGYNKAILGKHVPSPPAAHCSKKTRFSRCDPPPEEASSNEVMDMSDPVECDNSSNIVTLCSAGNVSSAPNKITATTSTYESALHCTTIEFTSNDVNKNELALAWNKRREVNDKLDGSVASGGVSSMSTLISSAETVQPCGDMSLVPFRSSSVSAVDNVGHYTVGVHPVFNTLHSNTVHRNYIVPSSATSFSLEAELFRRNEERRSWEHKVKELELQLAHKKENYNDMKEDLRDVKKEGKNGDKQIMIGNCIIL